MNQPVRGLRLVAHVRSRPRLELKRHRLAGDRNDPRLDALQREFKRARSLLLKDLFNVPRDVGLVPELVVDADEDQFAIEQGDGSHFGRGR